MRTLGLCLAIGAIAILAACGASGEGGREVNITQADDGCTPTVIDATPGEKLNLVVQNDSGKDYEVEGIDGAKLEEVIVPEGRTRSVGYNVPGSGGTFKVKCYVPGGVATIIEVRAGSGSDGTGSAGDENGDVTSTAAISDADATVNIALDEFTVEPDRPSVQSGKVALVAANVGKEIHELYVIRVRGDGSLEVAGEIENIAPGESGSMALDLAPGKYQLACMIVPGEAGSTADHYKEGMHTEFTVQ